MDDKTDDQKADNSEVTLAEVALAMWDQVNAETEGPWTICIDATASANDARQSNGGALLIADELRVMRARCDAATEGPWLYRPHELDGWGTVRISHPNDTRIVAIACGGGSTDLDQHQRDGTDPYRPNGEFIAHARADMPRLLDAVEALTAKSQQLCDALNTTVLEACEAIDDKLKPEIERLTAENARLRDESHRNFVAANREYRRAQEVMVELTEARAEIERLTTSLEISPDHPYDGIACRDETIRQMDMECDRLAAELQELRMQSISDVGQTQEALERLAEAQEALRWFKPRWSALGGDRIRLDVAKACIDAGCSMLPDGKAPDAARGFGSGWTQKLAPDAEGFRDAARKLIAAVNAERGASKGYGVSLAALGFAEPGTIADGWYSDYRREVEAEHAELPEVRERAVLQEIRDIIVAGG